MMKQYRSINEFKEGQVCPTHDCFSVWDEVWVMHRNQPMKVRIVEVIIRGFHRVGWQDFGIKKELFVKYKVNKQLDHYDYSGGDEVESKKVFATKELLLKSI